MGLLDIEAGKWEDNEANALALRDRFTELVNADEELAAHRTFIEQHAYGMGERCFHWLWKMIVDDMPNEFHFLEVGVYKGQVLSLVRLLANRAGKKAHITGVTFLSSFAGITGKFPDYPDEDYRKYIEDLHDRFGLEQPNILVGDSTDPSLHSFVERFGPLDLVYIDGCHEYDYVVNDLLFYPTRLREGGLLVMDDSANYMKQPWGFFQGIEDVSRAARTVIEPDPQWVHLLALVHNRVWRRMRPGPNKKERLQ